MTLTDPARFLFVTNVVTITKTGERRRVDMTDGLRQMLSHHACPASVSINEAFHVALPAARHVGDSLQGVTNYSREHSHFYTLRSVTC